MKIISKDPILPERIGIRVNQLINSRDNRYKNLSILKKITSPDHDIQTIREKNHLCFRTKEWSQTQRNSFSLCIIQALKELQTVDRRDDEKRYINQLNLYWKHTGYWYYQNLENNQITNVNDSFKINIKTFCRQMLCELTRIAFETDILEFKPSKELKISLNFNFKEQLYSHAKQYNKNKFQILLGVGELKALIDKNENTINYWEYEQIIRQPDIGGLKFKCPLLWSTTLLIHEFSHVIQMNTSHEALKVYTKKEIKSHNKYWQSIYSKLRTYYGLTTEHHELFDEYFTPKTKDETSEPRPENTIKNIFSR
ncbi:hypothetical protein [Photobacterium leiognathi]|uniref:hypothetical protein n=1 Tax=Photobacterium leiognathi TaxID=553611 RepID=UPI00298193EC|nr:hypothetical protein [Photobacterium leiognathi]